MSDIQNPTALSDFDWLEFVSFIWKTEREGYAYAAEHYAPEFEDPALPTGGRELRAFSREHAGKVDKWAGAVGGSEACDLHNAHVDETRRRKDDACLWGLRCTDGYVIHEQSEESASRTVAYLLANSGSGWRTPGALLRRTEVGGEWTETAIAIEAADRG